MALAYIKLSAKQYFNFMCKTDFERRIFHDSYRAFQQQSKIYNLNQSLHTFEQMCRYNEKAKALNRKLNAAVMDTIETLGNQTPNLFNHYGQPILFDSAELHIHASDLLNKAAHVVSLTYVSPKLVLHEMVANALILSYGTPVQNQPFMVQLKPELEITHIKTEELMYM